MYKVLHIPTGRYIYTDSEKKHGEIYFAVMPDLGRYSCIYLFPSDAANDPNALLIANRFFLDNLFGDHIYKYSDEVKKQLIEYLAMDLKYLDNKDTALNCGTPVEGLLLPSKTEFILEWYEGKYLDVECDAVKTSKKKPPRKCRHIEFNRINTVCMSYSKLLLY